MQTVGIICEYNPFHCGHKKQIDAIRAGFGQDTAVVCLMSGNFVQRGAPAIFHKSLRAQAALACGADLILELPVTYALSSAEGFAAGGVKILSGFCHRLCFGTETGTADTLMATAKALLTPGFSDALHQQLDRGLSFPAARAAALGAQAALLTNPNDILGVEYCKAILTQKSSMDIFPIHRQGAYHDEDPDAENPSATAVRRLLLEEKDWKSCVPASAQEVFEGAFRYTMASGERAVLARLRSMTDAEFEALPYGSEGLWRKFMHACRSCTSMDSILAATKSKRYTHTRISRMLMCAYLGISREMLQMPAPYTRVLAFNDLGRRILKDARQSGAFPHVGEKTEDSYWELEQRCSDLYGLFCTNAPSPAGLEPQQRVFIVK